MKCPDCGGGVMIARDGKLVCLNPDCLWVDKEKVNK